MYHGRVWSNAQSQNSLYLLKSLAIWESVEVTNYLISMVSAMLPALIKPLFYYLALQVYMDGYLDIPKGKINTFKGTLRMMFQPLGDTDVFYLNSAELNVTNYRVYTPENISIPTNMKELPEEEKLEFTATTTFKANQYYLLELNYRGKLRTDNSEGLYVSTVRTGQAAVATKFEPHYARRMVPCIDQPDAKAIWKVTLIHPKNTRAASNGERVKLIERKGWALTKFSDTPMMSTYLLSVFISDFDHFSGRTQSGTKVRLFASNSTLKRYKEIFDYSVDRLEFYAKFFDVDGGMNKLDQTIVNLGTAGMESWGLISYNERSMEGEHRLQTVSHEIIHQWLGNQVTPQWWDDLWITEGLATFLAEQLPYMGRLFHVYHAMQRLLEYEANPDPNQGLILPLSTKIEFEDLKRGRSAVMNYNVYNRGSMFAAMLHAIMGTDSFRKALQELVKQHRFGTVNHAEFIKITERFIDPEDKPNDYERFIRSWVEQAGHPILNVQTIPGGVKVTQERNFNAERIHPKYRGTAPFNYKYDVPVFFTTNKNEGSLVWLYHDQESIIIPIDEEEIISIDPFGEGMYKVHYSAQWYERWTTLCPEKKCHQDLFFKPCEEFLRIEHTYPAELKQKVIDICFDLDRNFGNRHPQLTRSPIN